MDFFSLAMRMVLVRIEWLLVNVCVLSFAARDITFFIFSVVNLRSCDSISICFHILESNAIWNMLDLLSN